MIMWFRRLAAPLLAGAVALGATGCASKVNDAATITYKDATGTHTVHITREQLERELRDLMNNPEFVKLVKSQYLKHGDGKNSVDSALAARWLGLLIAQTAVDGEFKGDKITVTSADTDAATSHRAQEFGQDVFSAFSKSFRQVLIDRDARIAAVLRYYNSCPSGRLVYHIATANHANAEKAFELIRAGQSFESVARAASLDTASAQLGGALGCLTPGALLPELEAVAQQVPFDTVTVPVKTRLGYDLVLVRKWTPAAAQAFGQQLQQAANKAINDREKALRVWVNPRYGSWALTSDGQGGQGYTVTPPAEPQPRTDRNESAVTSTTSLPAGG